MADGTNRNMGPAWSARKLVKYSRIAWLAANPIPRTTFPNRLVNSFRFDKAGRSSPNGSPAKSPILGSVVTWEFAATLGRFGRISRHGLCGPARAPENQPASDMAVDKDRFGGQRQQAASAGGPAVKLCVAQEALAITLKASNPVLSRKPSLIIWKPQPPTLIPRVCPIEGRLRNLFVNSVLARMADCRPTGAESNSRCRFLNRETSPGRSGIIWPHEAVI